MEPQIRAIEVPVGINEQQLGELMNQTIFRPEPTDPKWKQKMKERMIKYLNDTHPAKNRFRRIHVLVKAKLVFPGIRFLKWLLRKYIVKDLNSIPAKWHNSHLRMFYCFLWNR